ncbi:hypothetical protein RhiirA4_482469 [Rhizophagus irregularis]|uniref:Crinkler effector protein N-terminal domain-containing protein n=1 Tax=Rhizophagus irregularis TaxID=588596 RepID=A0A2I1HL30_9GLOM|nr:hypothetical protein RhiirA4_482469 [Rhizophagus irregularis]
MQRPEQATVPIRLFLSSVEIGGDHLDDQLKNLKLNGNDELSAINEIGDYWTETPPKKHIHVLVEPPVSTVTSSREQELLDELSALRALLNKSVHGTYFSLTSRQRNLQVMRLTRLLHYSVRCRRESEANEELQVDSEYRTRNPRWSQRTYTWSSQDTGPRQ